MPFLAVCASCGRESHVPDCAAGASVWCPQCARYFAPLPQNPAAPVQLRVRHEPALPFLAACTFCGRQSHVPAGARGTWLRCPQCANFFGAFPGACRDGRAGAPCRGGGNAPGRGRGHAARAGGGARAERPRAATRPQEGARPCHTGRGTAAARPARSGCAVPGLRRAVVRLGGRVVRVAAAIGNRRTDRGPGRAGAGRRAP